MTNPTSPTDTTQVSRRRGLLLAGALAVGALAIVTFRRFRHRPVP